MKNLNKDLEQQRKEAIERWKKAGLMDDSDTTPTQMFQCQPFWSNKQKTYNLQKLILVEDVFDALTTGKICTIRKGRRDIKLGLLTFESLEQKRQEDVFVKRVIYCTLRNIPVEYMINDGFTDHDDMVIKMKRFYLNIDQGTECTVVEFNSQYINDL